MDDPSRLPLPLLLGSLRQRQASGALILTQPGGTRGLRWRGGRLVRVEGEPALEGRPTEVLTDALSQPLLQAAWEPMGDAGEAQEEDLRRVLWEAFSRADFRSHPEGALQGDPAAHWRGRPELLESLADLPMTPVLAFAASRLGADPLTLEAIASLTGLPPTEASRLVASLWALGAVIREGGVPFEAETAATAAPAAEPPRVPPRPRGADTRAERALGLWLEAQAYAQEGRTSEAIRALEEALRWSGEGRDAYEPWLLLGRLRLGNPAWSHRAMEALRAAARLDPRASEPWVLMGGLYRAKGLTVNAEGCYRRAQALDPRVVIPPPEAPPEAVPAEGSPLREAIARLRTWVRLRG